MPDLPDSKAHPHPWKMSLRHAHAPDEARDERPIHLAHCEYAELAVTSNFTFLTGASHPDELVQQAAALGYHAIALTDCNSLAGIVRAHVAARDANIQLIVGCRLRIETPFPTRIIVYPTDRASYGRLCRLLTLGKRRAPKGECHLALHDLLAHEQGLLAVIEPPDDIDQQLIDMLHGLRRVFEGDRLSISATYRYDGDDADRLQRLALLSRHVRVPLVATNDVYYHIPQRRPLQDVLTCVRLGCTLDEAGFTLHANAERHLKPPDEMARLFAAYPEAIERTMTIARRAAGFNLDQLRYEYPDETCPIGRTPMQHLIDLTWRGAAERYPQGVPEKVRRQIEHEFALIEELQYAPYFLTVHDLVVFARSRGILCQGRGAAANSAVCYCLGVTAVDPDRIDVLFERFVSKERNEPPDIDIDFEHERREEVIQYIYQKYGRERAALTAEVVTYRGRSAVRDVGKALGLSLDCVDRMAKRVDWWDNAPVQAQHLRELGINPNDPTIQRLIILTRILQGFPRHLSQHVGGFVITRGPLCETVPIENAAMPDRTVIEWDKDDIEAVGLLKVDVLALGMLTCVRRAFEAIMEGLRDQGTEGLRDRQIQEHSNGEADSNLSRSDPVAEGHGTHEVRLCGNEGHAEGRAIWSDDADASGGGFGTVEHRRRVRSAGPSRLHTVSENRPRFTGGTCDAVRTGDEHETDALLSTGGERPHGGRADSSGIDHASGAELRYHALSPSVPRSLSPFPLQLHTIPPEDPAVYDMICNADTIGVFQIESRAQMSMLPRLRPRCYYDLVIEVAIVRPGPIQGDMVHPYLRRRNGEEPYSYPDETVERILGRTLGVPLFQEQAMSLAIHCAGFTPGEADQLRRAIAAWKRKSKVIFEFGQRIVEGMIANGYSRDFAERCFEQIKGFSEYGFPESHSASFALLVYVSAWLKCHYPAEFAAALLNSQPMGFYAPAQIVRDAKEHGVAIRPIDVNASGWDCSLEDRHEGTETQRHEGVGEGQGGAKRQGRLLRLGMRLIKGMRRDEAEAIARAVCEHGPFNDIAMLWRSSGVSVTALRRLARADAFGSMGLDRQTALWQVRSLRDEVLPLFDQPPTEREDALLPPVPDHRKVAYDYQTIGLSLKSHPVSFLRAKLDRMRVTGNRDLLDGGRHPNGSRAAVAGMVLVRQRPGTASGVVFMTIEDETGIANLIVRPHIFERFRRHARHASIILARGKVERQGQVVHIMVDRIESLDGDMAALPSLSRDFH